MGVHKQSLGGGTAPSAPSTNGTECNMIKRFSLIKMPKILVQKPKQNCNAINLVRLTHMCMYLHKKKHALDCQINLITLKKVFSFAENVLCMNCYFSKIILIY